MYIQILTLSVEELPSDLCTTLREECTATCDRLPGVVAHRWSVNGRTNMLSGMVKWTGDDALRKGTEALSLVTAILHPERIIPAHREIAFPVHHRSVRREPDTRSNTGFVTYPEGYDPRG